MTFHPTPNPSPYPPPSPPSRVPKYLLIGCGSLFVVALLGGLLAYFLFWTAVDKVFTAFTTERPLTIPQVNLSAAEYEGLEGRVRAFSEAIEGDGSEDPLILSELEINALIQRHAKIKEPGSGIVVRIVADQLESEFSIPASAFSPSLDGRFLNGKAVIGFGMVNGRVAAFLQDLRVGDSYMPDRLRERFHQENLLRNLYEKDDDVSRALRRIRSVEIRGGELILIPAGRAASTP